MSWRLLCPCGASGFALPATYDRCNVVLVFHVDRGEIDGLDVSDRTVAIVADTPKLMAEGNWHVGLLVDDRCSQGQVDALVSVFAGQKGGPMGMVAALVGDVLGVETAPIEYADEGSRHRVKIGDLVDIEIEDFVHEGMTEPAKLVNAGHPAASELTAAVARRSQVDAFGIDFSAVGKNGHAAPFAWAA